VGPFRPFGDRDALEVVVVDDGSGVGEVLRRRLRRHQLRYRVRCLQDADAMVAVAEEMTGGVIVIVVCSDDHRGLERISQLRRIRREHASGPAVVVVHHGATPHLDAIVTGAQDVIPLAEASAARLESALMGAVIRKEAEEAAWAEAFADPVTGLGTRAWITERIERAVEHSTGDGWQVAVLFCDLDRFKAVNDSLGHARGDELLALVADRLRGVVRADDPLARIGGDEFVILLEGHRVEGLAHRIALRAVAALAEPFIVDGHTVSVMTSIGLAVHHPGESAAQLLEHADLALYRAKRRGRNRIVVFDDELREWAGREVRLGSQLEADLAAGALWLEQSPILELPSQRRIGTLSVPQWERTTSVEALTDLATRRGLGPTLGRWVIEQAVVAAAADPASRQTATVVVPRGVALQPAFVGWVESLLGATGLDPSRLMLAMEEAELSDLDLVGPVLDGFDRLGASVAISDFGTGVGSLTLFGSHRIDEVHLAPSLTEGIASDPTRQVVLSNLVSIGHALGQRVVASGIRSREDLAAVGEAGCDAAVVSPQLDRAPVIELADGSLPIDITVAVG
jgi:diguanylate cyclase (GGDEF)-like protein